MRVDLHFTETVSNKSLDEACKTSRDPSHFNPCQTQLRGATTLYACCAGINSAYYGSTVCYDPTSRVTCWFSEKRSINARLMEMEYVLVVTTNL